MRQMRQFIFAVFLIAGWSCTAGALEFSTEDAALLLRAKTVMVEGRWGMVTMFDAFRFDKADRDGSTNRVETELRNWQRLTLVEDARKADLIFIVTTGTRDGIWERGRLWSRIDVYRGGVRPLSNDKPVWSGETQMKFGFAKRWHPAELTFDKFRAEIDSLTKSVSADAVAAERLPSELPARPPEELAARERQWRMEYIQSSDYFRSPELGVDYITPTLLNARTVAIRTFGSRQRPTAAHILIGMDGPPAYSNADEARTEIEEEFRKWGRFQIVDDVNKADLVLHMYVWDSPRLVGKSQDWGHRLVLIAGLNNDQAGDVIYCHHYTDYPSWVRTMVLWLREGMQRAERADAIRLKGK